MAEPQTRRAPTQKRSRERVDAILANATDMIAQAGSDALRMSELAQRTGISIGSLYQYFPDKSAVVRACRTLQRAKPRLHRRRPCRRRQHGGACRRLRQPDRHLSRDLPRRAGHPRHLVAVQADGALRAMEVEESRRNGALLAARLRMLRPKADTARIEATALLVMHLGKATMRLAVSVDRAEGGRLVAAYKRMAIRELTAL